MSMIDGGPESLTVHMEKAVQEGDYQWASELTDRAMRLNGYQDPCCRLKDKYCSRSLRKHVNAMAQNYFISMAKEYFNQKFEKIYRGINCLFFCILVRI